MPDEPSRLQRKNRENESFYWASSVCSPWDPQPCLLSSNDLRATQNMNTSPWQQMAAVISHSGILNTDRWHRNGLLSPIKKTTSLRDAANGWNLHRDMSFSMRYKSSNVTSNNFSHNPRDTLPPLKNFHEDALRFHWITSLTSNPRPIDVRSMEVRVTDGPSTQGDTSLIGHHPQHTCLWTSIVS